RHRRRARSRDSFKGGVPTPRRRRAGERRRGKRPRRSGGLSNVTSQGGGGAVAKDSSVSNPPSRIHRTRRAREAPSGFSGFTYTRISEYISANGSSTSRRAMVSASRTSRA